MEIKEIINKIEKLKNNKNFDEAIKLAQNTLITNQNDYRLYEELADIYLYLNKLTKANKAIDFALWINPESATWNYLKWFICLALNKPKKSIKYLEKSNSLMPNNSEVLRNLWWAYHMLWENMKWISILKRALNISPWDKLITEDLAMALISSWNIQEWNKLLNKIWKKEITT